MSKAVKIINHLDVPEAEGIHHKLTCLTGESKGTAYLLLESRIVFGRSEEADIQVLDVKCSREHAETTMVGKDYIITDLASQNGIIVNDLKVKQHKLNDGDKIIIGKTVYKYSILKNKKNNKKQIDTEFDLNIPIAEKKDNKRMTIFLGVILAVGFVLLMTDPEPVKKKKKDVDRGVYATNEINDPFAAAIKERRVANKKTKQKLSLYFNRGLREFREGNYFRAIAEFEHARQWSPSDPLAKFYLRKTQEALNKTITSFFNKAARDEEAVKYQKAITSYCSVIRLLHQYPEDERYKNAEIKIKKVEEILGMEEGEVKCLGEKDKKD